MINSAVIEANSDEQKPNYRGDCKTTHTRCGDYKNGCLNTKQMWTLDTLSSIIIARSQVGVENNVVKLLPML